MILKLKRFNVSYKIKYQDIKELANKLIISRFIPDQTEANQEAITEALQVNGFTKIEFII